MLAYCKEMLKDQNGHLLIHPKYTKLIGALRTAVEKGDDTLYKVATSHDDLFDAFRLSLMFWLCKIKKCGGAIVALLVTNCLLVHLIVKR
jgi:hypothetical protein